MSDQHHKSQRAPAQARTVTVDEPELSDSTNAQLTEDLRDVVGATRVNVPADRPHPSHGEAVKHRGLAGLPTPKNFIVTQVGAGLLIVCVIAALALAPDWWALVLAVIVLGLVTYALVGVILKMTSNRERPSPSTVAALEEDGVSDPEQHFSDIVAEFTADPGAAGENRRTVAVEDDAVKAAAEHGSAITPSGGPTKATGPGGPE